MQWSRSILGYGRTMSRGTVALVVIPLIGGIARIALRDGDHQPVTGDFCDNRSSRHGGTMLVAPDFGGHVGRDRHIRSVKGVEGLGDVIAGAIENGADGDGPSARQRPPLSRRKAAPLPWGAKFASHTKVTLDLIEGTQSGHAERIGNAPLIDFGIAGLADGIGSAPTAR